ncbi:glycoside hydrolase [Yokenella regensburgei]|uniref:glycoside hydrolase n=1 Tax=Yokenella regensburgei TaxID=158877 RepID=UPI003ED967EE
MSVVKVSWSDTGHEIEGFGVFAGRAKPFFKDKNRDAILENLFSEQKLGLNIIRGEVMSSFSESEGNVNFHLDANIDTNPGDPDYPADDSDDLQQRGQLYFIRKAFERYKNVNKFVASTWSPPVYMKSQKKEQGKWFNYLLEKYEDSYADYLAEFAKQFSDAGLPVYAISPMNEPEFFSAEWGGCFWEPLSIPAILYKLKSSLMSRGLDTKIMSCENANWTYSNAYLSVMMCKFNLFYQKPYPLDIFASHGYTTVFNNPGDIETSPPDWHLINEVTPRWITESCSSVDYDTSMKMGLKLAESIHNFIFNQKVSAYIYWLGAVNGSNEALISSDGVNYSLNKTYDAMGNFSRYIKPGFMTLKVSTDTPQNGVLVSAYKSKDGKDFSGVLINKNNEEVQVVFNIDHDVGSLTPYLTPSESGNRWQEGATVFRNTAGEYLIKVPAQSIVSVVN